MKKQMKAKMDEQITEKSEKQQKLFFESRNRTKKVIKMEDAKKETKNRE